MIIRPIDPTDKLQIDRIYNEFYSDNEYPNFSSDDKFKHSFAITDQYNKIIVAGGIKTIAEAVFLTDKNLPPKTRLDALLQGLGSSIFISKAVGYHQIHAFVNNDEKYVKILQRFGFKLIDAKLLVLDLGETNG